MPRTASLDVIRLRQLLGGQHEVITRAQALGCGLTRSGLTHRIRAGGPWQALLPGIYLSVTGTPDHDQLDMAALLYAGPGSLLTGAAALRHHGLPAQDTAAIDVLVPAGRQCSSRSFVAVQRTTRIPADIFAADAIRCVRAPRAVADALRRMTDVRPARALAAAGLASGACSLEQLERELAEGPIRHSALLRQVVRSIREGAGSAPRGALRALLMRSKLPLPVFDASIYDGSIMIARVDAWWAAAGVAAEVGSGGWQLSPGNWEAAMRRQTRLAEHGIIVLQLSASQLDSEPDAVLAAIGNALAAGASRGPAPARSPQGSLTARGPAHPT
jgi:hypothetical protein